MIKNILKSFVPQKFKKLFGEFFNNYFDGYAIKSYAQEGEDLILDRIFGSKNAGFYIDVGAHHPFRFSNTYLFYLKGWRGINIDPLPGSMRLFNKFRKRDINLEVGIGEKEDRLIYYMFNEPALNTFEEKLAKKRDEKNGYYIVKKLPVKVYPLSKILEEYLPEGQKIDFLTIDVEGKDFEVLKSNDWDRYRPKVVLVEILSSSIEEVFESPIYIFMREKGYTFFAKTFNTCFLAENEFLKEIKK